MLVRIRFRLHFFLQSVGSAVTKQISTEEVDVVLELVGHLLFFSGVRADGPKLVGRVEAP